MTFNKGDRVLINNHLATIISCREEANLVTYEIALPRGGTDTVTAPLSHTRIESLSEILDAETSLSVVPAVEEPKVEAKPETKKAVDSE